MKGLGRIAIVGSGAVGCYFGGRLAQAGEDVTFLMRSDYDVVKKDGLRVKSHRGDFQIEHPQIARSTQNIGTVDLVIVAWKTTANHLLEEALAPLVGVNTNILTLQNGMGNAEVLGELYGAEKIYGGLCFVCINRTSPGVVEHTANGAITLGAYQGGGSGAEIVLAFEKAEGVDCSLVENLAWAQWRKLMWNVPFNGLAITEGVVDTQQLLGPLQMESEVRTLMNEVILAAAALGHELSEHFIEQQIEATRGMGAYRPSSMIDFVEGRSVELEAIWQIPYDRAVAAGAVLPRWQKLLQKLKDLL